MNAYRIVSPDYIGSGGIGAFRWGSRWISPGRRAVHAAGTWSLAVLENLMHWQSSELPSGLLCLVLEIPDAMPQERIARSQLPPPSASDYSQYRALGDDWHDRGEAAALWIPSLLSPHESNLILNQTHPDFAHVTVHGGVPVQVDHSIFPRA